MKQILDKQFGHRHFTIRNIFVYGISSLIGMAIVAGGTWLLTDKLGIYYVLSTAISGALAFGIKFVVTAIWGFNDK